MSCLGKHWPERPPLLLPWLHLGHPHGVGAPHREHPDWRERVATHRLPPAESLPLSSPVQIWSPPPAPGLASLFPGHAAPTRDVHTRKGPKTLGECGQHSLSRQGSWMSRTVRSCSSKPPAPRGRHSVDKGQEGRGWPGGRLCVASPCGGSIRAAPAAPTASWVLPDASLGFVRQGALGSPGVGSSQQIWTGLGHSPFW